MRFMILIKANKDSEAGVMPSERLLTEMGKFNEELVKAGVMLAGEGLHPSSKGARVRFSGSKRTVIDGPFAETKELIAGFWIWQCKSKEEAIEWVKRCPNPMPEESEIEIRQVFEAEDFGPPSPKASRRPSWTNVSPTMTSYERTATSSVGKRSKLRGTPSTWGPPPGPYRSLCFSQAGDAGKSILIMNVHPSVHDYLDRRASAGSHHGPAFRARCALRAQG